MTTTFERNSQPTLNQLKDRAVDVLVVVEVEDGELTAPLGHFGYVSRSKLLTFKP